MNPDPNVVIERLGGTCATARLFEISPAAVADWRKKGRVPSARLHFLKTVRPDVLEDAATPAEPAAA